MRIGLISITIFIALSFGVPIYAAPTTPAAPDLKIDGYARVNIVLTVADEDQQHITFDQCPDQPLFGEDIKAFVGGTDDQGAIGVTASAPGGFSVTVTPIAIDISRGFLGFGRGCSTTVDRVIFQSPLFPIRPNVGQTVHVMPVLTRSKSVDVSVIASVDKLIDLAQPYINVPTAVAGQVKQASDALLKNMGVSNKDGEGAYLQILSNAPAPTKGWDIPGLLKGGKVVHIEAQIVPQDNIITTPDDGRWSPDAVLNTSFPVDPTTGGSMAGETLRAYFETKYSKDVGPFEKPTSIDGLTAACTPIERDTREFGFSARDRALLMWALVHAEAADAISADPAVDTIPCVASVKYDLPPGVLAPIGIAATQDQMEHTAYVGADGKSLPYFFTTDKWDDKSAAGEALFSYESSVTIADSKSLLLSNQKLISNSDWLAIRDSRDGPYMSHLGCYVFIPYKAGQSNLASKLGTQSIMLAIGQGAPTSANGGGSEAAIVFSFAPAPAGGSAAKIDRIDISDALSDDASGLLKHAFPQQCAQGWKPHILFGQ